MTDRERFSVVLNAEADPSGMLHAAKQLPLLGRIAQLVFVMSGASPPPRSIVTKLEKFLWQKNIQCTVIFCTEYSGNAALTAAAPLLENDAVLYLRRLKISHLHNILKKINRLPRNTVYAQRQYQLQFMLVGRNDHEKGGSEKVRLTIPDDSVLALSKGKLSMLRAGELEDQSDYLGVSLATAHAQKELRLVATRTIALPRKQHDRIKTQWLMRHKLPQFRDHFEWSDVQIKLQQCLPSRAVLGSKFGSQKGINYFVSGCQRSGTTWINRFLGRYIPDSWAFTEEQTYCQFYECSRIPLYSARNLFWQTTFINTHKKFFQQLPDNCRLIYVYRNPQAVVWSLLYNFELLESVYQVRQSQFLACDSISVLKDSRLQKAIEIYRHSLRVGAELIAASVPRTCVVNYDEFIKDPHRCAATLLGCKIAVRKISRVEDRPRRKVRDLSASARAAVDEWATPLYKSFQKYLFKEALKY
jgi:Sulfotransferase domain